MSTTDQNEKLQEEFVISGEPIVPGIGFGKVLLLGKSSLCIRELTLPQEEVEHEISRYYKALKRSRSDLAALEKEAKGKQGYQEIASILQAHLEIIKDPLLTEEVVNTIRKDRKNAEFVFSSVMGEIEKSLCAVQKKTSTTVDRIQDIHDISNRVIGHLCCQHKSSLGEPDQNLIVFSEELTPSEAANANPEYIRGLVSFKGSKTSHTAIVSLAKNIPYVANFTDESWSKIKKYTGNLVLINGEKGEITFNPRLSTIQTYYHKQSIVSVTVPIQTKTALPLISLSAQIVDTDELPIIEKEAPGTSVGLFRSEFMAFSLGRLPFVEEQAVQYAKLVQASHSGTNVLRLFDFGEDKACPFISSFHRSARWLLEQEDVLRGQLRAIAMASQLGKLKVLIPGVIDVSEIVLVKRFFEEEKRLLNGISENISWGSMIEIPSAVWMIEEILQEISFLALGTNDLTQYTLGYSRERSLSGDWSKVPHPSMIRTIHYVSEHAKQRKVPVSMCGEMAGDPYLLPMFLGLGIQELSVVIPAINSLKRRLLDLNFRECSRLAKQLLRAKTHEEVYRLLYA
ncbi:phosphoenolpyruvate--protein phosphotransferase [Chlamydia sp.]|uniref:phosphoenolpyruvate--protein phosphotransferase n=1 Tax=Chlamydia sp. TaxID=35827 RepID=UPI0025BAD12A|nr:phosphoenolpyruvate--protein phosphotransferase [Chlamydia sp.]MBQ8498261.1 phosphoenolpyruvate--protein phosphotransferase [Chlamydia sp.]